MKTKHLVMAILLLVGAAALLPNCDLVRKVKSVDKTLIGFLEYTVGHTDIKYNKDSSGVYTDSLNITFISVNRRQDTTDIEVEINYPQIRQELAKHLAKYPPTTKNWILFPLKIFEKTHQKFTVKVPNNDIGTFTHPSGLISVQPLEKYDTWQTIRIILHWEVLSQKIQVKHARTD